MPQNIYAIANYFIRLGLEYGNPVTPMKLQKLIFFAHGWYLALAETPLLEECVQAWDHGPVFPSIYHEFKGFGNDGIDRFACMTTMDNGLTQTAPFNLPPDPDLTNFLNRIWEVYGNFSAIQLSNMTHEPGTPWDTAVKSAGGTVCHNLCIANDVIKSFFKQQAGA